MKRIGLIALAGLLFATAIARDHVDVWIDDTTLPSTLSDTSTEFLDRNGKLLRAYTVGDGLWRLAPDLSAVDSVFLQMLVRYEDKRFWDHNGVDPLAMLRAGVQALRNGRVISGGSTLTMQVARLLEDGTTGKWTGKLRQIRLALALERRLSKQDILTLYLTHAPYGGNLEGIRAATLAWFGKEPNRLSPAESALLIALPQAPETRRPDRQYERAQLARDRVLERLHSDDLLDHSDMTAAKTSKVPAAMQPFPQLAAHISDRIHREDPAISRHDLTLDAGIQNAMERLIREAAQLADQKVSAALIVADHRTGEITASVGSPAYDESKGRQGYVDMTRAIRSPGSTLKPLIYGMAFDHGLVHPETLIHDGPVTFDRYSPRNFDGQFRGDIRVREALQLSLNIPVVKLTSELGPARVMVALQRSGADARLPGGAPGLAISLGGVGVSLYDLVQLYAALAQEGEGPLLRAKLLGTPKAGKRVMSEVAAWQVADILSGLAPPPEARSNVLAYKTGTSYGHRDAWAIGFDGRHVVGVWMGRADGTPVPGVFGGDVAAPVLFQAFERLKTGFDPLPPPPPATLIVGSAELPAPLRRFRPRDAHFAEEANAPRVLFPPEGAVLRLSEAEPVTLKFRGGAQPFAVFTNGQPVATDLRRKEVNVPNPGQGYSTFVIVDGEGRSDRVTVRLN